MSYKTTLYDKTILHHHNDLIGGKVTRSKKYYEFKMLNYIKNLGKMNVIVDAGANIGNHTLFFAKYCAETVYAFERAGTCARRVHINSLIDGSASLDDFQIMVFIGGFCWGGDHGAGVI